MPVMKVGTGTAELPPIVDETPATDAPKTVAVYENAKQMLAAPVAPPDSGNGVEGEFSGSDIKLPYLNLTQKTSKGELAEFGFGKLILDKSVLVGEISKPVTIVVLRMKKNYRQVLPRESQEMPALYNTMGEARAAGLVPQDQTNRKVRNGTTFEDQGILHLAVKAPEGVNEQDLMKFPFEFEGTHWAMCIYIAQSSAYGGIVKPVFTHTQPGQPLAPCIYGGKFEIFVSKEVSNNREEFFKPTARFAGVNTAEETAFFASIRGI